MFNAVLHINLYACIALVGLIWVIQVVHYPSFHFVAKNEFTNFISFHGLRVSLVVIPLMLLELVTSLALLFSAKGLFIWPVSLALILLLLIWAVTFLVSAPTHVLLQNEYNEDLINKLINTNWWRTVLWTLRSFILIFIVWKV